MAHNLSWCPAAFPYALTPLWNCHIPWLHELGNGGGGIGGHTLRPSWDFSWEVVQVRVFIQVTCLGPVPSSPGNGPDSGLYTTPCPWAPPLLGVSRPSQPTCRPCPGLPPCLRFSRRCRRALLRAAPLWSSRCRWPSVARHLIAASHAGTQPLSASP